VGFRACREPPRLRPALLYLHELADLYLPGAVTERRSVGLARPCRPAVSLPGVLRVGLHRPRQARPPGSTMSAAGWLRAWLCRPAVRRATLDLHHLAPGVYYVSTAVRARVPVVVVGDVRVHWSAQERAAQNHLTPGHADSTGTEAPDVRQD